MKVTENVYGLEATKGSYAYLITGEETVLIDTGRPGQGNGILKELDSLNVNPKDIKHILLTHHDVDHIGNSAQLQEITGAKLWSSREDLPYILGELKRHGLKKVIGSLIKVKLPRDIQTYNSTNVAGNIQVIETPGHTPGHVCLLYKDVLFAGDLVMSSSKGIKPSPGIMTWNKDKLTDSIKKVGALNFTWVCPAHGIPVKKDEGWML
ncbi:MAG: MBL fold metallo-hydrolase [Bacillota bacterium]|nr:MBL fold metallo-hydrolase [Bacillota bacterium]